MRETEGHPIPNGQAGGAPTMSDGQAGGAAPSEEGRWVALATGALSRPLRLADGLLASVRISESEDRSGVPEAEQRGGVPGAGPRRALRIEAVASRQLSTEDWGCVEVRRRHPGAAQGCVLLNGW